MKNNNKNYIEDNIGELNNVILPFVIFYPIYD